jgi:predicted XRE-type DNA-binding protein
MRKERSSLRSSLRAGRPRDRRDAAENAVATVGPHDNVFAALELPDADEWLAKAELARAIQKQIARQRLTQVQAAAALGGGQSDVSNLARGRLAGYSMERLYRFLNALGQDVRIVVQPKPRGRRQATLRALVRRSA